MITAENIVKIYDENKDNAFTALNGVSFNILSGELVAIVGQSGSGKTTLLNILGLLESFSAGRLVIDGVDSAWMTEKDKAKFRNQKIGFIIQDYALIEYDTVYSNIEMPLKYAHKKKNSVAISEVLKKVNMSDKKDEIIKKLSGGQKQRVAIARAIVNNAEIILADEPTGALDTENSNQVVKLLLDLNREGKTVIIVTHNTEIAKLCPRIIEIRDGAIIRDEMVQ